MVWPPKPKRGRRLRTVDIGGPRHKVIFDNPLLDCAAGFAAGAASFIGQGWVVFRFSHYMGELLYYCIAAVAEGVAVAVMYRRFGLSAIAGGFTAAAAMVGYAIYWAYKTNGWM